MTAIFARKEYQKDKGNLSHSHLMIRLDWSLMSDIESAFVDDLIRASICDIVRPDEVDKFVEEGVFTNEHDLFQVYEHAETYLPHRCNDRCIVKNEDGTLRCRKIDNVFASTDNRRHQYLPLPNDYSVQCLRILERSGLIEELDIDSDGNVKVFRSTLPFFHPQRHVPPTNPTNDVNISPVEGYTFYVMKSMQNIQRLTGTG